jgi:hypothetical protein
MIIQHTLIRRCMHFMTKQPFLSLAGYFLQYWILPENRVLSCLAFWQVAQQGEAK